MGQAYPTTCDDEDRARRLLLYQEFVQPQLPAATATLIQKDLMYEVQLGLAQFGCDINFHRYEQRELVHKFGTSVNDMWDGHAYAEDEETQAKWKHFIQHELGTVEQAAEASFLNTDRQPETYRQRFAAIVDRYHEVLYQALTDSAFVKTFNKSIMIRCYYDHDCLPGWMVTAARARIRQRRHVVKFVHAAIEQVDEKEFDGPFDLISTSNLFDWMEQADGIRILQALTDKLSNRGAMLIRLAFASAQELATKVPNACPFDMVPPEDLAQVDYSHYWFRNPDGFAVLKRRTNGDRSCQP